MNIGNIARNATGHLTGSISTLTVKMVIALRTVMSNNPNAPKFEIMALSAARDWVKVGALFEQSSRDAGLIFYNGKIEDPSLHAPLYISLFRQEDGSYNVVWSRPTARRQLPSEMAVAEDALPPLPGEAADSQAPVTEGLGGSTAAGDIFGDASRSSGPADSGAGSMTDAFSGSAAGDEPFGDMPPASGRGRRARKPEAVD